MLAPKIDQLAKQQALARAQEEFGVGWAKPKPLAEAFQSLMARPEGKAHSFDPWWLARFDQQMEKTALNSLNREGLVGWYPSYKDIRSTPLRRIPPKKRDQAELYKDEIRRPRFPGYILLKRLSGHFDLNRLFDLEGCGSLVTVAGSAARMPDFEVEVMRLAEADGSFDEYHTRGSAKPYKLTREGMDQKWTTQADRIARLDESAKWSPFADAVGRVARYIASADHVGVTLGAKL